MEKINSENKCPHPGCACEQPSAGEFCSDHCRNAQKSGMDEKCRSGHPPCEG